MIVQLAPRSTRSASVRRTSAIAPHDPAAPAHVGRLLDLAVRGLAAGYLPGSAGFAQTLRAVPGGTGHRLQVEGRSVRYAAIAALGLGRLPLDLQREVLQGATAADVARRAARDAASDPDPGAAGLAAWALAEVCGEADEALLGRLERDLASGERIATVAVAWALTAAVATYHLRDSTELLHAAHDALAAQSGPPGLYPHLLRERRPSWRGHVGSFADQIYPVQALARAGALLDDAAMLALADSGAATLCDLQGAAGQWWWHYDSRTGDVVERFPVYSVHQHAMAPMVLHELAEAGGADHRADLAAGLGWLRTHPEVIEELESERFAQVWRKVGRREPRKAARGLGAAATALRPGTTVPGLDRVLPARVVDHECRPYELGWLLYAWLDTERETGS